MHVLARLGSMTAASVIIVVVVSGSTLYSVANLIEDQRWFGHSREVISEFRNMMFHMAAAVGDERGYLLSGQLGFLEDYRGHVKLTQRSMERLKSLVQDNTTQSKTLQQLSGIMEERLRSFDQSITAYQTLGKEAGHERVRSGQGTEFIEKVRAIERSFEAEEMTLLNKREGEMLRSVRASQLAVIAGGLLSIALVAAFNFFFGRHIVNCIKTLLNASENAEQGRFNSVDLDADDEFGELAEAFNHIGLTLENLKRDLDSAQKESANFETDKKKQQDSIQLLHGLIDELAIEFQSYYAALDRSREELERALASVNDAVRNNSSLETVSSDLVQPIESANQKSTIIFRTTTEVRRLLSTTAENLSSLKQSIEHCSEQADRLAGLQSELDNIGNALEVISMSVDMTAPSGEPVLGAVMMRLHELSERCNNQRRTVGESISRMQTLLSRGMLTAHASSGAESTGRKLLDGLTESIETLSRNLEECRSVSTAVAARVADQAQALTSCRDAIADMSENRRKQIEVIEKLQESVGQTADDFIRA